MEMTLQVGGREAALKHFANAHTDGDTYVHFADANIPSTGDIVTLGTRYPNIDFANGGMIAATGVFLELANSDTHDHPGLRAADRQGRSRHLPGHARDGAELRREAG
jgi:hypothetical protein